MREPADDYELARRSGFARDALSVGVWVDSCVPISENVAARDATVRLGYRLGLAQAAATATVRAAVNTHRESHRNDPDFADWRDYVLPVFYAKYSLYVRTALHAALAQSNLQPLGHLAGWYSSIGKGLDFRGRATWASPETRREIDAANEECWRAGRAVQTGALALRTGRERSASPTFGDVPLAERATELALYRLGLAQSALAFSFRTALREAAGLRPLPVMDERGPMRLEPGQGAREAAISAAETAHGALAVRPATVEPSPFWLRLAQVQPRADAQTIERCLAHVLGGSARGPRIARALGARWGNPARVESRLALRPLGPDARDAIRVHTERVASCALALIPAASGARG